MRNGWGDLLALKHMWMLSFFLISSIVLDEWKLIVGPMRLDMGDGYLLNRW
jgi:hypothetical protein